MKPQKKKIGLPNKETTMNNIEYLIWFIKQHENYYQIDCELVELEIKCLQYHLKTFC